MNVAGGFLFDRGAALYYFYRMTKTEIISFRCVRSKRELKRKFGNVSRRLNALVEREFAGEPRGHWSEILERPAPKISRKDFARCMIPE